MERLPTAIQKTELRKEEAQEMTMDKISVLKIDKDLFVDKDWLQGYIETVCQICRAHGVRVTRIKMCASRKKGQHFYIWIRPKVDATVAVYLHWLLGDDCQRVDYCRARVASGLNEWNKLFEVAGRRLRTVYTAPSNHPARFGRFALWNTCGERCS